MAMRTALAVLAVVAGLAPTYTPALARAQDEVLSETCAAIFNTYDSADRQIALLNAEHGRADSLAAQSLYQQQIGNWMLDKSNMLQLAQLQHCPLPAGRTFGPAQYQRLAERCLVDRQASNPNSRNCDTARWDAP